MNEFWLIFGMFAVTFAVRYPVLALVSKLSMPESVIRALRFVPVAVLTALTVPYVLYRDTGFSASYTNPYLVAGIFAILVSYFTRKLMLTIVLGLVMFFVWRALLGI